MPEILHLIPGRIRLRFEGVRGDPSFARRVQTHLEAVPRIERVTANARTGSVLVLYDARALRSPTFLNEVSHALGKLSPDRFAPGRLQVSVPQLKGNPELTRALETRLGEIRGIRLIRIDPASGDLRIDYDPQLVTSPDSMEAISDTLRTFVPWANPGRIFSRTGPRRP